MSGVVVTGAASGIGRASAEALVADGRKVALWDIAPEVTAVADGLGVPGAVVDVCDAAAMQAAVGAADEKLRGIDGLLHAAGRLAAEPVGAYTQEPWDAVLDVNLRAQALLLQLLLPHLEKGAKAGAGPAIVGISSIEGLSANPYIPAYCASKADLLGMTRSMAAQLRPLGIRINAVCPGLDPDADAAVGVGHRRSPSRIRAGGTARPDRSAQRNRRRRGVSDIAEGIVHHGNSSRRRRGSDEPPRLADGR
jgi:NAD(P)-dependent dehydrogenase (short-subunit alcohol dehydrogenase family)